MGRWFFRLLDYLTISLIGLCFLSGLLGYRFRNDLVLAGSSWTSFLLLDNDFDGGLRLFNSLNNGSFRFFDDWLRFFVLLEVNQDEWGHFRGLLAIVTARFFRHHCVMSCGRHSC